MDRLAVSYSSDDFIGPSLTDLSHDDLRDDVVTGSYDSDDDGLYDPDAHRPIGPPLIDLSDFDLSVADLSADDAVVRPNGAPIHWDPIHGVPMVPADGELDDGEGCGEGVACEYLSCDCEDATPSPACCGWSY